MKHKLTLAKTNDYCKGDTPVLTVVMIHGIASDSSTYNKALEFLKKQDDLMGVRFVTFDLLGAGKSEKSDALEYTYDEQLSALRNAIDELKIKTPLVLMGHSLGTFIVTRYASIYPDEVDKLVLISPPIYTTEDFENPAFKLGIDGFRKAVSLKDPEILKKKSFNNSMENIVLDQGNYDVLAGLAIPTVLIYGTEDQLIASYNVPKILKENKSISAIKTSGRHGITEDKYKEVYKILAEEARKVKEAK